MGISQRVLKRFFNNWTGIGTSVPGPRPSDITTTSLVPGRIPHAAAIFPNLSRLDGDRAAGNICTAEATTRSAWRDDGMGRPMTDETKKRTEAIQRAAECRGRAAQYESLANEAKLRGDFEMSTQFATSAAAEWLEARRLEDSANKSGD
jgi:hypothetical protein